MSTAPGGEVRIARAAGWPLAALTIAENLLRRTLDVAVAGTALVLLSPMMLVSAVAIRLDSPGPAFFRQVRVGRNRRLGGGVAGAAGSERRSGRGFGRQFVMYKFRTMHADAAPYARSPTALSDSRLTRLGAFLRATCLDELPQLFNVLRGDMGLVGPRPEMPFVVQQYGVRERRRLEVTPGITGLWQVRGPRDRAIHEALEWDLEYLQNRSLKSDFAILVETVGFMFRRRNR